jgi:hypothetical protein
MSPRLWPVLVAVSASLTACSSSPSSGGGAGGGADAGAHDAGPGDAGPGDASPSDAGTDAADSGPSGDAGMMPDGSVSYSTTFDAVEAPISESGAWTHLGLDWALVDTKGGVAFGTQTGTGKYDDSYAHLGGFPSDHKASAVIHRNAVIDPGCTHEVEIHLRWSDGPHNAHGYECNLAFDGSYAQIVRWNGALGDFTYLASGSVPGGVHDGDTISASAVGDLITLYVNGAEITHANDSTWTDGNPGMGFWRGGTGPCGTPGDYGFTSYTATSLP